jgi:hypothetical protein
MAGLACCRIAFQNAKLATPVGTTSPAQSGRHRAAVDSRLGSGSCLSTLGIVEEPFTGTDGNCQVYARQRTIAVSPLAELPHKIRFQNSRMSCSVTPSRLKPV